MGCGLRPKPKCRASPQQGTPAGARDWLSLTRGPPQQDRTPGSPALVEPRLDGGKLEPHVPPERTHGMAPERVDSRTQLTGTARISATSFAVSSLSVMSSTWTPDRHHMRLGASVGSRATHRPSASSKGEVQALRAGGRTGLPRPSRLGARTRKLVYRRWCRARPRVLYAGVRSPHPAIQ